MDFIGAFELGNCWKGLNVMVVLIEVMKLNNTCIAAKDKLSDDNQPTATLSVNGKIVFQKTQLGRLCLNYLICDKVSWFSSLRTMMFLSEEYLI